jgi:hypothetical protein
MFLKDLSSFWQVTYCFLTSLDIVVYLLLILVNVPTFFRKILPFPAPREEWKEETKEETKRRQRGGAGFSYLFPRGRILSLKTKCLLLKIFYLVEITEFGNEFILNLDRF